MRAEIQGVKKDALPSASILPQKRNVFSSSTLLFSSYVLRAWFETPIRRGREQILRENSQMNPAREFLLQAALFVILSGFAAAGPFISGETLQGYGSSGRNLLQEKQRCPINFEFMNYTIITSKCKGPQYRAELCCSAFKDFACPYTDQLNDLTNDCASNMFTYINLNGNYPPGLFAFECIEGKKGLDCSAYIGKAENSTLTSAANVNHRLLPLVGVASGFIMAILLH